MTDIVPKEAKTSTALVDAKAEFMAGYSGPEKIWPREFRVTLDNSVVTADRKTNPGFGKLFMEGHKNLPDGSFENFKEEIDLKKTEFFVLKKRVQINGKWNEELKAYDHSAEEVDFGWPIELKDSEDNIVYEGSYNQDVKKQYNLSWKQVLYVMPVMDGKLQKQVYRWLISGASTDTWFKVSTLIDKASKEGTILLLKVTGTIAKKKGQTDYNEILFATGKVLPFDENVKVWSEFNHGFASYLEGQKKGKAAEESTVVESEVVDEDFETFINKPQ